MTMAVRISACGSGLATPAFSAVSASPMIGGASRVTRPERNSRRLTALPNSAKPMSARNRCGANSR